MSQRWTKAKVKGRQDSFIPRIDLLSLQFQNPKIFVDKNVTLK